MATALKRQKKPKLGETELLMLYCVAIYEVEFRRINAIEQQPFIWCESGFVLNEQERELLDEFDMVLWEPKAYEFTLSFANWMQVSRCRAKLETCGYLQLKRLTQRAMIYRVTEAGDRWLLDNADALAELGQKDYTRAKEDAMEGYNFGPDPQWVRTGRLSLLEARGMVRELANWMRSMECLQEEEVAELTDELDTVLR